MGTSTQKDVSLPRQLPWSIKEVDAELVHVSHLSRRVSVDTKMRLAHRADHLLDRRLMLMESERQEGST